MSTLQFIPQEVERLLEKAFKNVSIVPEEKKMITGAIFIGLYKGILEVLLGFLGNNTEFSMDMANFFQRSIEKLSPTEKQSFEHVIEEEKMRLFETVLTSVAANLSHDEAEKIKANLSEILKKN